MISVIVPLYNKELFVAQTIHSVLNQTFDHFEILVINDGSTDSSLEVVSTIKDERLRIISIENSGVSVARNTGIEHAKYDWIAFLDADDWWAPTFISDIKKAMNNFTNQFIFATGRSRVFNKETERYSHTFLPENGATEALNYFQIISKYLPPINSSNVVIHKNLFHENGYFKEGQLKHEDHDLWLRLCIENEVIFINKPLSFYRKTEADSASNSHYNASDFLLYLNTIKGVYDQLSETNKHYLKMYANRFTALTYLKNYKNYTSVERDTLNPFLNFFCEGNYRSAIRISRTLPFSIYPFLKLLQLKWKKER
ncbi:glycosyltransferase family 2 protein [Jejudonia soesokkakensis]|uniref:Glycosyltransferase family 2 protein n=1 Tax=Jejudonia soesokkakensis TaxID=1323432 RepID=A0ABW2MVJ5_9FLAO